MNNESLLQLVEQEYKDVTLGDNYTLAEEDYADTSYWYFDKPHPDSYITEQEWEKQEISFFETCGWLSADQEEAIQAIKEKRKMRNRFENPFNIPSFYLNMHFTGFSYLDPQAYLFYTPAIMINYLSDPDFLTNSFTWWLSRLKRADSQEKIIDLLKYFSEKQIKVLEEFLVYVFELSAENNEVKKILGNLKLIRQR